VLAGWTAPSTAAGSVVVIVATAALFGLAAHRRAAWGAGQAPGRAVWLLLAAGYACLGVARAWTAAAGRPVRGLDGLAAADWLAIGYPLLVAATGLLLLRERGPRWLPGMWWDGAVVALGALALGAAAIGWMLGAQAGGAVRASVVMGFPVLEVALSAGLLVTAAVARPAATGLWWVSGGVALAASSDVAWYAAAIRGRQPSTAALEVGLATGYALAGVAAARVVTGGPPRTRRPSGPLAARFRAVLPAGAFVLASTVLVGAALLVDDVPRPAGVLALGCLVLGLVRAFLEAHRVDAVAPDPEAVTGRTDDLTGLANRLALSEALTADADPGEGWALWTDQIALLLVDLDRFKDVNDALGHEAGDLLLTEVGSRLQSVLRPTQLLARLGGDEFAVLLPGAGRLPAARVAGKLRAALEEPFEIRGSRLHVQASVGVATCRLPSGEPGDLLRRADVAMYRAKESGAGVEVYEPQLDHHSADRLKRIDELRSALLRGDLEVHLQPQVDLRSGQVVGAEALARWRHPQDGVLLPDAFLPLAAQTGLLGPVAALVLDRALQACATWWHAQRRVPVSVNLTALDLRSPGLPEIVAAALRRHGLPPGALRVEITEEAMLTDRVATSALLRRWRADGVSVAIDDYGTGYSSLAYLRELPVDELKLDRVFVADLQRRTTATIVKHTIAMAHGLRLHVVAEGVEDEATARTMADLGCDVGQGLYFGAAMGSADFLALLEGSQG
jgi:diguanylate cyclase (GGDEF)-like protein